MINEGEPVAAASTPSPGSWRTPGRSGEASAGSSVAAGAGWPGQYRWVSRHRHQMPGGTAECSRRRRSGTFGATTTLVLTRRNAATTVRAHGGSMRRTIATLVTALAGGTGAGTGPAGRSRCAAGRGRDAEAADLRPRQGGSGAQFESQAMRFTSNGYPDDSLAVHRV